MLMCLLLFHYSDISFCWRKCVFWCISPWKMSAIFISESSFSVPVGENGALGIGYFQALISSVDAWFSDLLKEIPDILVFSRRNPTVSVMRSDLVFYMSTS